MSFDASYSLLFFIFSNFVMGFVFYLLVCPRPYFSTALQLPPFSLSLSLSLSLFSLKYFLRSHHIHLFSISHCHLSVSFLIYIYIYQTILTLNFPKSRIHLCISSRQVVIRYPAVRAGHARRRPLPDCPHQGLVASATGGLQDAPARHLSGDHVSSCLICKHTTVHAFKHHWETL